MAGLGAEVLEPAVLATRIGGREGRALPFLPLARAAAPYAAGGGAARRLGAWAAAAETGCLRALLELDRLAAWEARARTATAGMSGRTPGFLVDALLAWPALSAGMADARLVHEITGQGRFRFWRVAA